jgi:hypothetical protein
MTNPSIDSLLARVAASSSAPPHREAIDAIRTVEQRLLDALGGATLRGMPNLGTSRTTLRAVNVRTANPAQRVAFPGDGQVEGPTALVLLPRGALAVAWFARSTTSTGASFDLLHRGADDGDLQAEDLPLLLQRLPAVLSHHLARAEQSQASWRELSALAHRVLDLVPGTAERKGG